MAQHRRLAEHCDIVLNDADVVAHVASLVHGSLVFTKATAGVIDITQRDSAISLYTEKRRGVRLVGSAVSEPPPFASLIFAARSSRREWR